MTKDSTGAIPHRVRLGVNIDHVATIRNARGGAHPSPLAAALQAEVDAIIPLLPTQVVTSMLCVCARLV